MIPFLCFQLSKECHIIPFKKMPTSSPKRAIFPTKYNIVCNIVVIRFLSYKYLSLISEQQQQQQQQAFLGKCYILMTSCLPPVVFSVLSVLGFQAVSEASNHQSASVKPLSPCTGGRGACVLDFFFPPVSMLNYVLNFKWMSNSIQLS